MPAINLHDFKVYPEESNEEIFHKIQKPPKMALFTIFFGKTLKVICRVKEPKYGKTVLT